MKLLQTALGIALILQFTNASAQGALGVLTPSLSANSNSLVSRTPDSRGWTDPALNHNRLLANRQGEGSFTVVGQYKVKGSCFLFGQLHNGDVYAPKEQAFNINISYNTYNQELEFVSTANPGQPLVKEPGELDSFVMKKNIEAGLLDDITFVYGSLLGNHDKTYFQVVEKGSRFSLYKRYKSELAISGNNYGESELREFQLTVEYYYYDTQTKKLKKLKANTTNIVKEFKSIQDLTPVMDPAVFSNNPEEAMKNAIRTLNNQPKGF